MTLQEFTNDRVDELITKRMSVSEEIDFLKKTIKEAAELAIEATRIEKIHFPELEGNFEKARTIYIVTNAIAAKAESFLGCKHPIIKTCLCEEGSHGTCLKCGKDLK